MALLAIFSAIAIVFAFMVGRATVVVQRGHRLDKVKPVVVAARSLLLTDWVTQPAAFTAHRTTLQHALDEYDQAQIHSRL